MAGCNRCNYHDVVSSLVFDKFKSQFKFSLAASVFISPDGMQMLSPEGNCWDSEQAELVFYHPAETCCIIRRPGCVSLCVASIYVLFWK